MPKSPYANRDPSAGLDHTLYPGASMSEKVVNGFNTINFHYPGVGNIDCAEGHVRYDGTNFVPEPDVFYIEEVGVDDHMQRQGFATSLTDWALEEAAARGFKLAEAGLTNPAVVGVFEKMRQTGRVKELTYILQPYSDLRADSPVAEAIDSVESVSAAQAEAFLARSEQEDLEYSVRSMMAL